MTKWKNSKLADEITTTTVPIGLTIELWEGGCFNSKLTALAKRNCWYVIGFTKLLWNFWLVQIRMMCWMRATQINGSSGLTALSKNTQLSFSKSILDCAILNLFFMCCFACSQPAVTVDRERIGTHLWPRSKAVSRYGQQWKVVYYGKLLHISVACSLRHKSSSTCFA